MPAFVASPVAAPHPPPTTTGSTAHPPTSTAGSATLPPTDTGYAALPPLLRRITGDEKHEPSANSTLDVLWVLYDRILRISPQTVDAVDRDRFLLSKGHGPAAYYAVLAAKGFIPDAWLDDLAGPDSPLGHHPDRLLVPGVEIGSGSLGHGLGLGVGMLLGLRAQGLTYQASGADQAGGAGGVGRAGRVGGARVYVLVGDAELDEGSNHEAIAYAGSRQLAELTAIVVDNDSATHGWPGGLASRFSVNGWTTTIVDGRDHEALTDALTGHDGVRPHLVVARTPAKYAASEPGEYTTSGSKENGHA
ncbi:transketolase [Solwaraspora sp. WMMD792]|uniref:transketolase n=1 Tax=Solwaraspora sp. WMMD792 TaxID=3016099 RepID=UPI002416500A|nr:transketolase [Solwaraspora sp. WMMD792]MDG4773807.1 transketolase [Solwaraspora sp. WMMD792]